MNQFVFNLRTDLSINWVYYLTKGKYYQIKHLQLIKKYYTLSVKTKSMKYKTRKSLNFVFKLLRVSCFQKLLY